MLHIKRRTSAAIAAVNLLPCKPTQFVAHISAKSNIKHGSFENFIEDVPPSRDYHAIRAVGDYGNNVCSYLSGRNSSALGPQISRDRPIAYVTNITHMPGSTRVPSGSTSLDTANLPSLHA